MRATHTIKSGGKWYAKGEEVPYSGASFSDVENETVDGKPEEPKRRGRKSKTED